MHHSDFFVCTRLEFVPVWMSRFIADNCHHSVNNIRNQVDELEWRFLLTGGIALDNPFPNPAHDWLTDKSWAEITRCSDLAGLKGFMEHFSNNVY